MIDKHAVDPKSLPRVARKKPYLVELTKGKNYRWCACGLSENQPFCDDSHVGTGIEPLTFTPSGDQEVLLCGCKKTGDAPWCDGSHNDLVEEDTRSESESPDDRSDDVGFDESGKARLDGNCLVVRSSAISQSTGTDAAEKETRLTTAIGPAEGARWMSQHFLSVVPGERSRVFDSGDSQIIGTVVNGSGAIEISGKKFDIAEETGFLVRPGEAFCVTGCTDATGTTLALSLIAVPGKQEFDTLDDMPDGFDKDWRERRVAVDPEERASMGTRYYQILVEKSTGSDRATQYIAEIPQSRKPPHRQLFEEIILVLRGQGILWTDSKRVHLKPGDVILIPPKQSHSLHCSDAGGMVVIGVVYPGENPAINY